MRQVLLTTVVLLGGCARTWADETTVPRYLEFRDGTVLKLPVVDEEWRVSVVRPDGKIEAVSLRLSSLERLVLMAEPVFEKKRALLEIIGRLGSEKYQEREAAQDRLLKMGPEVRPDLESALDVFTDLEVRSRLVQILGKLPPPPTGQPIKVSETFDQFVAKESLHGDAGVGSIAVKIDGQTRRLGRKDVNVLTTRAPELHDLFSFRTGAAGFRRLMEAKEFPPGCIEESFDTTPTGRKLTIGENIEKLFVSKGFTLTTSIGTSFVSVNDFTVQGKSRGLSAATHQPLFQGEVTIRFCRPGNEAITAGVTHFGLWIAHVAPRGTSMVAYDVQGRELGSIQTTRDGHEFLGVQSNVPIHRIKIVPNLQVDPDFTLDDFLYLLPRGFEGAHPEKFLAHFADGERIFASDVSVGLQGIRLHGLTAGLPDRTRPVADLVRVAAPEKGRQERTMKSGPGVFVELRDGSVVFGGPAPKSAGPQFLRRPGLLLEKDEIVGLWSTEQPRSVWPDKAETPVAWDAEKKTWQKATDVTFTDEAVVWTVDGKRRARSYFEVGPLLLGKPAGKPQVGSWRVRTLQGEEFVLGDAPAVVSSALSRELEAKWGKLALKVPAADLVSIYRVMKEE